MKIAVAALAVILQEDPFHDIGNLCFNRLEQYDQILHGTVAGTDIHAADFFTDGLLHAFQSVLNGFDVRQGINDCLHRNHDQVTAEVTAVDKQAHLIKINSKITVIQIKCTTVAATFTERVRNQLQIFSNA